MCETTNKIILRNLKFLCEVEKKNRDKNKILLSLIKDTEESTEKIKKVLELYRKKSKQLELTA